MSNDAEALSLDRSDQKLERLPSALPLRNLRFIYISNNRIRRLPEDFFSEAPNLIWLDARCNRIEKLPDSLDSHAKIETLLLDDNEITHLPAAIARLDSLGTLHVAGNPIVRPKRAILEAGLEAVKAALRGGGGGGDALDEPSPVETSRSRGYGRGRKPTKIRRSRPENRLSTTLCPPPKNSERYLKAPKPRSKSEQDLKVYESLTRNERLEKKRELYNRKEKILQDAKSLAALKSWRKEYHDSQSSNMGNTYYALDLSNLPYDTDLNHVKILTRADIENDLPDKYRKKIKSRAKVSNRFEREPTASWLQTKIDEVLQMANSFRNQRGTASPKSERRTISCEIKQLTELQKKIKGLKAKNDRSAFGHLTYKE